MARLFYLVELCRQEYLKHVESKAARIQQSTAMVIVMNIKVVVGKDIRKERHRLSVVMVLNGER
jgi:hypothetical protein